MSAESIAYHLRPHKSVDRRLFLDLLVRLQRWTPLEDHVYISMGAYTLEDHRLIHRHIGVNRMISFDSNEDVVKRQIFNRPIENAACIHNTSDQVITNLDAILENNSASDCAGIIFWLDYTSPREVRAQLGEFEALLNKLSPGDIVRVTLNANPNALGEDRAPGEAAAVGDALLKERFEILRRRLGEFIPEGVDSKAMTKERFPTVLSRVVGSFSSKAFPAQSRNTFLPLYNIAYTDGTQMLSITGIVIQKEQVGAMISSTAIDKWPFYSPSWDAVHRLVVPTLTLRERLHLERGILAKSTEELTEELGFDRAGNMSIADFVDVYRRYYRFYPSYFSVDV